MAGLDHVTVPVYEEDSINLLDLLVRFVSRWKTFVVTALISILIGAVMIYRIKPLFESNASILLSGGGDESGGLAALFSGHRSGGDTYVGLLRSRAVLDNVIRRMGLRKVYQTESQDVARGTLASNTKIFVGPDSILVLMVRNADASMATKIANSYLEALEDQQISMASTQSGQRRKFFAQQLEQAKDALTTAEEDLRKTQESLGILVLGQQTSIGISAIADLRAQITASQVRLASLRMSETEQNPEVQTLRTQIAQLQSQEHLLGTGAGGGPVGAAMASGRMPTANLEYTRKEREVQYRTALFNSLQHEVENARISEAAVGQTFQVVDRAVEPEFRAWPDRHMLFMLTYAGSAFLGLVAVALELFAERVLRDPENRMQLNALRKQFHVGR